MPIFKLHFRQGERVEPDDAGMDFPDLHQAYLDACKAIPDIARDVLIKGQDPMICGFMICDARGRQLMDVPFADILSPSEWRMRRALRGPHSGYRSHQSRDRLALSSFRRMFGSIDIGCLLLSPDLQIKEMNAFCAAHSHIDAEAIRNTSILNVLELTDDLRHEIKKFWAIVQRGSVSEIIDLPYLVLDSSERTRLGWWKARAWPIFDDDDHLIGLVGCSQPSTVPFSGGETVVRVGRGSPV